MKVSITGSSGFIGSAVVNALERKGMTSIGVDLAVPRAGSKPDVFHRVDMCGATGLRSVIKVSGVQAVIHLAEFVNIVVPNLGNFTWGFVWLGAAAVVQIMHQFDGVLIGVKDQALIERIASCGTVVTLVLCFVGFAFSLILEYFFVLLLYRPSFYFGHSILRSLASRLKQVNRKSV